MPDPNFSCRTPRSRSALAQATPKPAHARRRSGRSSCCARANLSPCCAPEARCGSASSHPLPPVMPSTSLNFPSLSVMGRPDAPSVVTPSTRRRRPTLNVVSRPSCRSVIGCLFDRKQLAKQIGQLLQRTAKTSGQRGHECVGLSLRRRIVDEDHDALRAPPRRESRYDATHSPRAGPRRPYRRSILSRSPRQRFQCTGLRPGRCPSSMGRSNSNHTLRRRRQQTDMARRVLPASSHALQMSRVPPIVATTQSTSSLISRDPQAGRESGVGTRPRGAARIRCLAHAHRRSARSSCCVRAHPSPCREPQAPI